MSAYTKRVSWTFEVEDEVWEVTEVGPKYMCVSETRMNGQEDTHVSFVVALKDGDWVIDEGREMIADYREEATVHALEAFFKTHGVPEDA